MAEQIPTRFQAYLLTTEEEKQAYLFTITQKQGISNLLSEAAERLLNLRCENGDTLSFFTQQASLEGQIAAYTYLLERCAAEEENSKQQDKQ